MQVTDAMVAKAAEVAYLRTRAGDTPWDDLSPEHKSEWCEKVRPVIAAALAEMWRPVSEDSSGLLYFPAKTVGAHRQATLGAMMKVGCASDFPNRQPTHFMPLPAPPMGK